MSLKLESVQFSMFVESHESGHSVQGYRCDDGRRPVDIELDQYQGLVRVKLVRCGTVMLYPVGVVASMRPLLEAKAPPKPPQPKPDPGKALREMMGKCANCGGELTAKQKAAHQRSCGRKCGQALRRKAKKA